MPAADEKLVKEEKQKKKLLKGTGHILVMDDDASVRKITGRILERFGYKVTFAKNGDEAIYLYRKKPPFGYTTINPSSSAF